jgi:2-hydroxy-3-keto-5-methylthiopentenyl-1-phosphate phosphatase
LTYSLAKVLLYGLGQFFPVEKVYSSAKVGHEHVFEKIVQKYGKSCTYVVIGDGISEEQAAKKNDMPFWRISNLADLRNLHRAMEFQYV